MKHVRGSYWPVMASKDSSKLCLVHCPLGGQLVHVLGEDVEWGKTNSIAA